MAVMHQVALLRVEVSSLRKANEALDKHRRAKKHSYSVHLFLRKPYLITSAGVFKLKMVVRRRWKTHDTLIKQ